MGFRSGWIMFCLFCGMIGGTVAQSSQSKILRIDNSDIYSPSNPGGIQYTQGWNHMTMANQYNNTLSSTQVVNASAVFFFRGSAIAYYSSKSGQTARGNVSIDGIAQPIPPNNGLASPTWSMSGLDGGDHQFIITRGNETDPYDFSLDYLEVTYDNDPRPSALSPAAINAPASLVNIVENRDERIIYKGTWSNWRATIEGFYFGGGLTASKEIGSSVSFSFNGTAVWFFSEKLSGNAKVLVSVDGGEGEVVNTALAYNDKRWFTQALCWSKTDLNDGLHTINIVQDDEAGRWLSVDFLAYASIPSQGSAPKPKVSVGAVVGGAVGGGIGVILICALIYRVYRRRKTSREDHPEAVGAEAGTYHESAKYPSADQTVTGLPYRSEQWHPATMVTGPNSNKVPTDGAIGQWSTRQYPHLPEPYAT